MSKKNSTLEKALTSFQNGIHDFLIQKLMERYKNKTGDVLKATLQERSNRPVKLEGKLDIGQICCLLNFHWETIFKKIFSNRQRSYFFEIKDARNSWAHQKRVSTRDLYRVLDSIERLLKFVESKEWKNVQKLREYVLIKMADKIKENRGIKKERPQKILKNNDEMFIESTNENWRDDGEKIFFNNNNNDLFGSDNTFGVFEKDKNNSGNGSFTFDQNDSNDFLNDSGGYTMTDFNFNAKEENPFNFQNDSW